MLISPALARNRLVHDNNIAAHARAKRCPIDDVIMLNFYATQQCMTVPSKNYDCLADIDIATFVNDR